MLQIALLVRMYLPLGCISSARVSSYVISVAIFENDIICHRDISSLFMLLLSAGGCRVITTRVDWKDFGLIQDFMQLVAS